MTNDLKHKAISGLAYRFSERILAQLISTIVSIILARILLPEEYGIISLVSVLITLCNVFVTDGLGSSLIQNRDVNDIDFSTCFWAGLFLSVIIYICIFIIAPILASFYEKQILIPIMRVMGLRVIIASLNSIQHAYISKYMQFRKFFWATLSGTIVSAIIGIFLAFHGAHVWALVAQYMTNSIIDTIFLFFVIKWKPKIIFSYRRFINLFSYAWKLFVSAFLNQFYNEFRTLIIVKEYTSKDLAYYNKGYSFPSLIVSNINSSINSVTFPLIAKVNDDQMAIKIIVKRGLKLSSYIIFPMLLGFAAISHTFVEVVLTKKWLNCVPFLQIFCIADMISPMNSLASNVIRAVGRSDIVLKNNIIIKIIGFTIIMITIKLGVIWIAIGSLIASLLALIINTIPLKRLIGYSCIDEFIDILPHLILSIIMSCIVFCVGFLKINIYFLIIVQIIVGILFYVLISKFCRLEQYTYLKNEIKNKINMYKRSFF